MYYKGLFPNTHEKNEYGALITSWAHTQALPKIHTYLIINNIKIYIIEVKIYDNIHILNKRNM